MGRYVEIDRELNLAQATFFGAVTYQERMDTLDVLCPQMRQHGINRLLLDFSSAWISRDSVGTREQLMEKILAEPALHGCRVAFVDSVELQGVQGSSKPAFEVRRFERREEADAWLREAGRP